MTTMLDILQEEVVVRVFAADAEVARQRGTDCKGDECLEYCVGGSAQSWAIR